MKETFLHSLISILIFFERVIFSWTVFDAAPQKMIRTVFKNLLNTFVI